MVHPLNRQKDMFSFERLCYRQKPDLCLYKTNNILLYIYSKANLDCYYTLIVYKTFTVVWFQIFKGFSLICYIIFRSLLLFPFIYVFMFGHFCEIFVSTFSTFSFFFFFWIFSLFKLQCIHSFLQYISKYHDIYCIIILLIFYE